MTTIADQNRVSTQIGVDEMSATTEIDLTITSDLVPNFNMSTGVKWGGGLGEGATVSYSFPQFDILSRPDLWSQNHHNEAFLNLRSDFYFTPLKDVQTTPIERAMDLWSSVANINFEKVLNETPDNVGDYRFFGSTKAFPEKPWTIPGDPGDYSLDKGFPNFAIQQGMSDSSAGLYNNYAVQDDYLDEATQQYLPLFDHSQSNMREIRAETYWATVLGQSLGLNTVRGYVNATLDTEYQGKAYSLYGYNQDNFEGYENFTSNNTGVMESSLMLLDILAAQTIYGANMNHATGNDVYVFNGNRYYYQTIWDAAGNDTIKVISERDQKINLNDGEFSHLGRNSGGTYDPDFIPTTFDLSDDVAIAYGAQIENAIGGNGNDLIIGNELSNVIDGGAGNDVYETRINMSDATVTMNAQGEVLIASDGQLDTLSNIETIRFNNNQTLNVKEYFNLADPVDEAPANPIDETPVSTGNGFNVTKNGQQMNVAAKVYDGPVSFLEFELLGDNDNENVIGTDGNDFINLLGGHDAVQAGAGDDVIDGGMGSNFLFGNAGKDTFFLDGRSGTITWSTVADFEAGESINIWGWQEGVSRLVATVIDGAEGYQGATQHFDLDNNGEIDTSITLTGLSIDQMPESSAQSVAGNGYLLMTM